MGRPFDQLRVLVSQGNLNVKLVCTHAGILTGEDGMSAHGIEDLSLICSLAQLYGGLPGRRGGNGTGSKDRRHGTEGPFYIRLSRAATPVVHDEDYRFELGKAEVMREGSDVTIAATGVMVSVSLDAAEMLAAQGVEARVLNVHTLKPVDEAAIIAGARETGALVSAEEHYFHGGLGSIVAQVVGQHHPVPLEMVALQGYSESARAEELMVKCGLTPERVRDAALKAIARK